MKIFFNNELLEQSDMTVEAFSRGICYGDAVFETLRVVNKRTLIGGKHLERLRKAASFFGMDYNLATRRGYAERDDQTLT